MVRIGTIILVLVLIACFIFLVAALLWLFKSETSALGPHRSSLNWQAIAGISTAFIAFCALGLTIWQAKLGRDDYILRHPPRVRITNVVVWDALKPYVPPNMTPGAEIGGAAFAVNIGRAPALMYGEDVFCEIKWLPKKLPIWRFYNGRKPNLADYFKDADTGETRQILRPGDYALWQLKTTVPPKYTRDADLYLYVIGAVFYRDKLKTRYARLFARRYDPAEERFDIMSDYPDYESEE